MARSTPQALPYYPPPVSSSPPLRSSPLRAWDPGPLVAATLLPTALPPCSSSRVAFPLLPGSPRPRPEVLPSHRHSQPARETGVHSRRTTPAPSSPPLVQ